MGKKENFEMYSKKKDELFKQRKLLEKKIKQLMIPCSHTNSKGKLKVNFKGKGENVECVKCGTKFNFAQIELKNLESAIMTVHNAINQIKAFSNNPDEERDIIVELGQVDYNLSEIYDLYVRAISNYGKGDKKKNKNKNNKNDGFGSFGMSNIGLSSGKKKNYYK